MLANEGLAARIDLIAYRPSGSRHMAWRGRQIYEDEHASIVLSYSGEPVEHLTRNISYKLDHDCLAVFPAARDYNVMLDFDSHGAPLRAYVNLAQARPSGKDSIEWTDLYLDLIFERGQLPRVADLGELETAVAKGEIPSGRFRELTRTAERLLDSNSPLFRPTSLTEIVASIASGEIEMP